jgi:uncharacterized membrane protein YebE (DUF533 family)
MFDAKSILESIVRGAAPPQSPQQSGGGGFADILNEILKDKGASRGAAQGGGSGSLGDILSEIGRTLSQPQGQAPSGTPPSGGGGDPGNGLGEIFGELARKLGQPSQTSSPSSAPRQAAPATSADQSQGAGPDLGDILAQLKDKLGQAGGSVTDGGSITDVLGKIFTQATQGVKEGATRVGEATGARDALGRVTGNADTDELLAKLKAIVQNSPFAAGTAAGGLGGLVLGTRAGRSLAANAVRIGALAMIGGLAYKAVQNYQAGRPLITGATSPEAAPAGSGFEPAAVTNDAAAHYIQAMIAAAAADGRIDAAEHDNIIGGLKQAGVDSEAEAFLANELNNPPSVQDLARSITSPQEAVQVYTAARIAVTVDSPAEKQFLGSLAQALAIDPKLAAHIDATAASAAA